MGEADRTISLTTDETAMPLVDVVTGRGFVTGKSGSGKSNTASVLAEELLAESVPMLIIDTDGEYYGLKEQYEVLHVGGDEHCDLQVGPRHADQIAEVALTQRIPTILDVSGFIEPEESRSLVYEVVRSLFVAEKTEKTPFLLLVEEAHEFIPEQGGLDELGEMLVRVAKRGRKRGLGICAISQRPASVDKDYITQCDWLVWHRLTWENDTKVVAKILGSEAAETVQTLEPGEALLLTDWDDQRRRVMFRRKETYDAGATPGLDDEERPELKAIDEDLIAELQAATGTEPDDDSAEDLREFDAESDTDADDKTASTSNADDRESAGRDESGGDDVPADAIDGRGADGQSSGTDDANARESGGRAVPGRASSEPSDDIEWEVAAFVAYLVGTATRRLGRTLRRGGHTVDRLVRRLGDAVAETMEWAWLGLARVAERCSSGVNRITSGIERLGGATSSAGASKHRPLTVDWTASSGRTGGGVSRRLRTLGVVALLALGFVVGLGILVVFG